MGEVTASAEATGWTLVVRAAFVVLALLSLVLGYIGLGDYVGGRPRALDLVYWDLQLFVLDSAPLERGGELPITLEFARFGAPAATIYALLATAQAIFGRQVELLRARFSRRHTIVCGSEPAVMYLAGQLMAARRKVVVVDPRPTTRAPGALPPAGVLVVVGDPRDPDVLRRAGLGRARHVMALTTDSAFNVEVAHAVRASATGLPPGAVCYAEVEDRELCAELAAATLSTASSSSVRVEFFSRHDRAARRLLERWPLPSGGDDRAVIIVGSGPLAQALLVQLARRWQAQHDRHAAPPAVRVIDRASALEGLADLPIPPRALALEPWRGEPTAVTEASHLAVSVDGRTRRPSHLFVCLDDDASAIRCGLGAARLTGNPPPTIVIALATSTVFGRVLLPGTDSRASGPPVGPTTVLHNVTESVYSPQAVEQGDIEEIARAAHDAYVASCTARGETPETNSSLVPWDRLRDDLKDDNRAQAADIGRKLAAINCAVVPTSGRDRQFTFDEEAGEVERLAKMEHERWVERRQAQGWSYARERDDDRKLHPDLVHWDDLPEDRRARDRVAVREIPDQLSRVGLAIVRAAP